MLTKYFDIQMYLYIFIYRLHKNEVNLDLGRKKNSKHDKWSDKK